MQRHVQAELQLRASQEKNQTLIDNSLTGIYIVQDGVIVFSNAKFAHIHGYTIDQIVEMSAMDLIHPLDKCFVAQLHKKRIRGEKIPEEYETRCLTRDGRTIWVQRRNSMIHHNGRPAVLGNEIDITLRRQTEGALKTSEEQLKRLVARLLHFQEVERKAIAREMHEEIAQSLSAIKLNIETHLQIVHDAGAAENGMLVPIIDRIKEDIQLIRRMTHRLSPIMLGELGIQTALDQLFRQFMQDNPTCAIESRIDIDEAHFSDELKIVIYRVLEELLAVSRLHGRQERWLIAVQDRGHQIVLSMQGNRPVQALKTPMEDSDLKFAVIKNRVESAGGGLEIVSRPGQIPTMLARWPLKEKRA
jgi:PAS domain S-box-containing protein